MKISLSNDKHYAREFLNRFMSATTTKDFEAACKLTVELHQTGKLLGPTWVLEDTFFKRAGEFYPSITGSELKNEIKRQIEENIIARARNIYPNGKDFSFFSLSSLQWTYSVCFLSNMYYLGIDMESFCMNYCKEENDEYCFHIIPVHVARFLSMADAYTQWGNDHDFDIINYGCRAFKRKNDIYIYIPEPAEHSRYRAAKIMENEVRKLRESSYDTVVSLQKGDNLFNTVPIYESELADKIEAFYAFLSEKYPSATYQIISHSEFRELPNVCHDLWRDRFEHTIIRQSTGFRLSIVKYSPNDVVAYIVMPEYHDPNPNW